MLKTTTMLAGLAVAVTLAGAAQAQGVTLVGASQFNEDHAFTKTMREFERLVTECYSGDVTFDLHLNSELGLEKDYFENMSQGIAVDYAVVSPAHMSTFSQMAPLMDMPFLFRDLDHWNAAIDAGTLDPIAQDILENADVRIVGYAGGGTRNVFANRPVTNMEAMKGLSIRMQGAPIWTRVFDALGTAPTVIAYSEVYNAIQTGVIEAAENEAAGIEQMKFYEVGPEVALTQHAITVRPLAFANATYQRLDAELQACIDEAGAAAGALGREIESSQDAEKLAAMEAQGWLTTHPFADKATLLELAAPVMQAYADELGAGDVYAAILAVD